VTERDPSSRGGAADEAGDTDLGTGPLSSPAAERGPEPEENAATTPLPEGETQGDLKSDNSGPSDGQLPQRDVEPTTEDDYLEEAFYPPTSSKEGLEVGSEHRWGDLTFTVERALPKGWYEARHEDESILVQPQPQHEIWSRLPRHPLLPRILYSGSQGLAVAHTEGRLISPPFDFKQSLEHILALAQLVRFFEAQQQAVLHIDPDGLLLTEAGLRLQYPPRLTPIGTPLPDFYREGYTAPEVRERAAATGKEGVYALAALMLQLLTGKAPPPEGPSLLMLGDIRVPGLPQLLSAALAPSYERTGLGAFVQSLKALREQSGLVRSVFEIGAATTVGLNPERPVNEDCYGFVFDVVESYGGLSQMLRACVADGMGGEAAGELASRAAVETFCRETPSRPLDTVEAQVEWTLQLGWSSNKAVLEVLSGQEGGCTLTGIVLIGNRLSLAHVGDTRAYLANDQGLAPLTKDHSLVNALVANGMMTAEEAQASPERNKILRSLGSIRQVQEGYIDSLAPMWSAPAITLAAGDTVVLVSDGVWGEVNDERIRAIAARYAGEPQVLAEALVDEALQAGAPDNATALVVKRSR
jgi:PPM family protein phosphatase